MASEYLGIDFGGTMSYICFVVRYGEEVERYFDFYLRTPALPKEDVAKALLARGTNALKLEGERLFVKAQGYSTSVM